MCPKLYPEHPRAQLPSRELPSSAWAGKRAVSPGPWDPWLSWLHTWEQDGHSDKAGSLRSLRFQHFGVKDIQRARALQGTQEHELPQNVEGIPGAFTEHLSTRESQRGYGGRGS